MPSGSGGVLLLDYWQGNRCPHNDPDASGVIAGITMNTTREQIYRAACSPPHNRRPCVCSGSSQTSVPSTL